MDEMEELKQEFLSEAYDLLNLMEDGSLKLEQNPEDSEAINGIFRVAHTLKGGAASLELSRIANFTHELENLFDKVRDGMIRIDDSIIDIILKSLDILKALVNAAAKTVEAEPGIEEDTLKKIINAQKDNIKEVPAVKKQTVNTKMQESEKELIFQDILSDYEKEQIQKLISEKKNIYIVYIRLNPDYPMKSVSGLQIYTVMKDSGEIIYSNPSIDSILEEDFVPEIYFVYASGLDKESLYDKVYTSDVTNKVQIQNYTLPKNTEEMDDSFFSEKKSGIKTLTQEDKNNINRFLKEGKNVFKVSLEIEKDNPMREVDTLLMYNTIESLGEIVVSVPEKEELKQDIFYPFLEMIVSTQMDKEKIKEKCTITGTTKNVKIAVFKSKNEEEAVPEKKPPLEIKKVQIPENQEDEAESFQNEKKQGLLNVSSQSAVHKSFLKVESSRVDILMNLVSELVISKAGLIETAQQILYMIENLRNSGLNTKKIFEGLNFEALAQNEDDKMKNIYQFFNSVTRSSWNELDSFENIINIISRVINELQESVMKIRMIPISSIFNRFPRIVRDLAKNLNKKVTLDLFGEETELDKSVIEELLDPMVHMIRNSIDHGIEIPDLRKQRGKSEEGKITLSASHEGSMIKIQVQDDGNGLDTERIKAKAIEKGLIPENKDLTKEEILNLIFQPGFSTAFVITEVSGRGVGMDVVKRKIDNLSGSIFVETEKHKGTKFIIKIPLTLAIIQALIVEINSFSYSIPINSIVETLSITEDQIENFENNAVIRLRDEIITVINIKDIFNFKEKQNWESENHEPEKKKPSQNQSENLSEEENSNERYVVIVELSNKKAGLLVDTVISEQDIVIKPLHKKYAMTKGISGATILGDGRISLIIDISQLIDMYVKKEEYILIK